MSTVKSDKIESATGGNPDIEYDGKDLLVEYRLRESLLNSFALAGLTFRDDWVTATAYALDDVVIESAKAYKCISAHTSGVFATDLAANKWLEFTGATAIAVTDAGGRFTGTDAETVLSELFDRSRYGLNGYLAASGTDTYAAAPSPALTAYTTGETYAIYFANENTVVVPTLNLNSLGAKDLVDIDGTPLVAGSIDGHHLIHYNGTKMVVLNPNIIAGGAVTVADHDHAYDQVTTTWAASTAYVVGDKRQATSPDGTFYFECTSAGTSDSSEPAWPGSHGGTVVDNTVTWTARDGRGESLVEESFPVPVNGTTQVLTVGGFDYLPYSTSGLEPLYGTAIVVPRTGVYGISWRMGNSDGVTSVDTRVYKNAAPGYSGYVAIGSIQSTTQDFYAAGGAEKTETSIALNAGDLLMVYGDDNGGLIRASELKLTSTVKLFG